MVNDDNLTGDLSFRLIFCLEHFSGDSYLKPYVTSEPEVTITERTVEDECLILASDGLWDVVSNETACGVARMCLRSGQNSDQACTDASILLTRLALARHSSQRFFEQRWFPPK